METERDNVLNGSNEEKTNSVKSVQSILKIIMPSEATLINTRTSPEKNFTVQLFHIGRLRQKVTDGEDVLVLEYDSYVGCIIVPFSRQFN